MAPSGVKVKDPGAACSHCAAAGISFRPRARPWRTCHRPRGTARVLVRGRRGPGGRVPGERRACPSVRGAAQKRSPGTGRGTGCRGFCEPLAGGRDTMIGRTRAGPRCTAAGKREAWSRRWAECPPREPPFSLSSERTEGPARPPVSEQGQGPPSSEGQAGLVLAPGRWPASAGLRGEGSGRCLSRVPAGTARPQPPESEVKPPWADIFVVVENRVFNRRGGQGDRYLSWGWILTNLTRGPRH